ncbi:CENP-B homolog protein 2-like [Rhizophagus clarus]|uniref:CENP-B homolog protein 2-like n=1 Tax=Rhizophagus clarus TaxID=94130 RepID=A0A8H3KVX1_9GLOM|nr:CENP-B homolog protein 2-like [Rhizophagus clarus]
MMKQKITLTKIQKYQLCLYTRDNKKTPTKDKRLASEVTNPEAKRHRAVAIPELELAFKEFILTYQHRVILSNVLLIEKTKLLAEELEVPEGSLQGEADSTDGNAIVEALPLLQSKCAEYPPERIYNMDETGLFYWLELDQTLATKQLAGRKKNKERLSITLYTNADGLHKLNPLVIEWLKEFDHQVGQRYGEQRVLLLIDNCKSHKIENLILSYVEVYFLPPNTTSKLQPLDAGIIMAFKKWYRRYHIRWMLEQVEAADTIKNCWNHIKILSNNILLNDIYDNDSILDDELARTIEALNLPNRMEVKEFITIPEEEVVYEIPKDSEVTDLFKNEININHPDEIDDSIEEEIIGIKKALQSLKTVHTFLL